MCLHDTIEYAHYSLLSTRQLRDNVQVRVCVFVFLKMQWNKQCLYEQLTGFSTIRVFTGVWTVFTYTEHAQTLPKTQNHNFSFRFDWSWLKPNLAPKLDNMKRTSASNNKQRSAFNIDKQIIKIHCTMYAHVICDHIIKHSDRCTCLWLLHSNKKIISNRLAAYGVWCMCVSLIRRKMKKTTRGSGPDR